ncbi:MAG: lipopolysaccharide transport periplasmic protein LptA [Steroidobacteraceae bacterium]
MALSRSSLLVIGLTLAARAVAAPDGGTAVKQQLRSNPQAQITLDAASSEVNAKTGTVNFIGSPSRPVVLSQGNTRVRADRANTTCLKQGGAAVTQCANSRWTFQGNVQIDAPPRGSLRSDQAVVEVRDNRIARATVTGNPAEFEQQRADAMGVTRGHADQIVYDVSAGTVRLTNDAWVSLSGGRNDIASQQIVYNIRSEKVQASSPGTQGVHITLTPQSLPKKGRQQNSSGPPSPTHGPQVPPGQEQPGAALGPVADAPLHS